MNQSRIEAALAEERKDIGVAFSVEHFADIECQALFAETLNLMVSDVHPVFGGHQSLSTHAVSWRWFCPAAIRYPSVHRPVLPWLVINQKTAAMRIRFVVPAKS
jgi:DNA-binding transcriptional LysR family regulator